MGPSGAIKNVAHQNGSVLSETSGQSSASSSKFCDISTSKSAARKHSLPLGQNDEFEYMENNLVSKQSPSSNTSNSGGGINDYDESADCERDKTCFKSNGAVTTGKASSSSSKWKDSSSTNQHSNVGSNRRSKNYQKESTSCNNIINHKDDHTVRYVSVSPVRLLLTFELLKSTLS